MKKNKRTSKVTPAIKTKPFANLPKPSFKSFGQLYQLIERRLDEERNKNTRLINWILEENNFNDEQLIGFLLLEMLFFKKRLKTVDMQKTVKKALSYEDHIAKEVISQRSIFSLLTEKQLAETLLTDEQLFQLVLADQPLIEQIFEMTFDYIPENPLLQSSPERALPSEELIVPPTEPPKIPPTEPPDDVLSMIKAAFDEVKNLFDKPQIYEAERIRALNILSQIEVLSQKEFKRPPMETYTKSEALQILKNHFNDELRELNAKLRALQSTLFYENHTQQLRSKLQSCKFNLKHLENLLLQIDDLLNGKQH